MLIIFSFCLNWGSLCFMPVFHIAAMLIMCSIINRCSLRKLYTHQFQGNKKKYINSAQNTANYWSWGKTISHSLYSPCVLDIRWRLKPPWAPASKDVVAMIQSLFFLLCPSGLCVTKCLVWRVYLHSTRVTVIKQTFICHPFLWRAPLRVRHITRAVRKVSERSK
jgi:hypothetical protein